MTTHVPYGPDTSVPPPAAPAPAYRTAPPWASQPASLPDTGTEPDDSPGAITPYGAPYPDHGKLLVPYPEEMHNAARPRPPSWWPVVAWTVPFGVFGLLSASRRAGQARRARHSRVPYWVAWAVTAGIMSLVGVVTVAVGVPAFLDYREEGITKVVQENLRTDGRLRLTAQVTVTSAVCSPIGPRDTDGLRLYDCMLALDDGRTGSLKITAGADGAWTAVPKR